MADKEFEIIKKGKEEEVILNVDSNYQLEVTGKDNDLQAIIKQNNMMYGNCGETITYESDK